ncbi:MAG: hypothetical protein AABW68_00580 [archaeon]
MTSASSTKDIFVPINEKFRWVLFASVIGIGLYLFSVGNSFAAHFFDSFGKESVGYPFSLFAGWVWAWIGGSALLVIGIKKLNEIK